MEKEGKEREGAVREGEGDGRRVKGRRGEWKGKQRGEGKGREKERGRHPPHHEIMDPPLSYSASVTARRVVNERVQRRLLEFIQRI